MSRASSAGSARVSFINFASARASLALAVAGCAVMNSELTGAVVLNPALAGTRPLVRHRRVTDRRDDASDGSAIERPAVSGVGLRRAFIWGWIVVSHSSFRISKISSGEKDIHVTKIDLACVKISP